MSALLLIPGVPLITAALLLLFGRRIGKASAWLTVLALASTFFMTIALSDLVFAGNRIGFSWAWLSQASANWTLGLSVDGLSWVMLVVVTSIGTLIALYSIGYMHHDPRFSRFFAYLSLFCASMLGLVMADHFLLLYACWELVGLCSYLLISFWFEKSAAAEAGRKAFLTTRIGDTGMLLGILILFWSSGSLQLGNLAQVRQTLDPHVLTLISALLFFGAIGKSAQVPLHIWLPDAMEGPTPVSALIHAATMVAAGVYLVARTFPLFTPESLTLVLGIGLITHLFAATIALTMTDIKRVLAYSTISQLGLMMTALGLKAMPLALFHLCMHAFCKALLFLGAGSVIHGTHQQELEHLRGLRHFMPLTWITFLIAVLSLSGAPFLSGFWSKDAILLQAQHTMPWVFWSLVLGALLTATYLLRLYLRCFHGSPSSDAKHAHESPAIMTVPLILLAIFAAGIGLVGSPWMHHVFFRIIGVHEMHEGIEIGMVALSAALVLGGFWLAWQVGFRRRQLLPASLRPIGQWLYQAAFHKYYVDEFYGKAILQPFYAATRAFSRFDQKVVDGAVNAAGSGTWRLGQWKERVDRLIVDRAVNGVATATRNLGLLLRLIQTGIVHQYLLMIVVAIVALAVGVIASQ